MCDCCTEGNEVELLSFETRFSGTLKVARTQQQGRQLLQMSLPLNMPDAPVPESAGKSSPLVQVRHLMQDLLCGKSWP